MVTLAEGHHCKDGSEPSPGPWRLVPAKTPYGAWIIAADGSLVASGFGYSDQDILLNARHAHDTAAAQRDTLNQVRRRLLDLATGRNPAQMAKEAAAIANVIRTRLDTPERGANE